MKVREQQRGEELYGQEREGHSRPGSSGPRSRIVEAIAVLLLARPMRAAEIAEALGYPTRYVSSYLSYWRYRGLFDYENGFWTLTEAGEEYARSIVEREMNSRVAQYAALARKILAEKDSPTVNDKTGGAVAAGGGGASGRLLPFTATETNLRGKKRRERRLTRNCIRALLAELELDEDERTVLEALLDHYARWGSTYTYLDHLEKSLDADRMWLMNILRLLQSKKLVYIYNDRRLGVRVGLAKPLREQLRECQL